MLELIPQTPQKSLSADIIRFRPAEGEFNKFKDSLNILIAKTDEADRENRQEIYVRDFLNDAFYRGTNEINKKNEIDLAIHLDKTKESKVGVIIEAKRPSSGEMISVGNLNAKAFHQLVLYFMHERDDEHNIDLRNLIITNVKEWFIFSAADFNRLFYENAAFRKDYEEWRDKLKVGQKTKDFYDEIAKPFIESLGERIECTHFELADYKSASETALTTLWKVFSPFHLLKKRVENDSNVLDNDFYRELLYIIGLEEKKEGAKTLIKRRATPDAGSLIEKTIDKIESKYTLFDQQKVLEFGADRRERIFNIALELCIVWINRILFLKLLESQLVAYHENDIENYRFLNKGKINNFGELYVLFHDVLNQRTDARKPSVKDKYSRIPYLNSSLFDFAEVERLALTVNELDDNVELPLAPNSILRKQGEPAAELPTLEYIFRFLSAYDFASEGKEGIQKENRSLINASVLGKVFEKINGYKEGSVYTPGFVTMYMCRRAIRLAVVQKFKNETGFDSDSFEDLCNYTNRFYKKEDIERFNALVNDLKLCDPAVGSGHFLVSALNEILAIKSELGIFADAEFNSFSQYKIKIANDEIIVTDRENQPFRYIIRDGKPLADEMQNLQKTLFHEKQLLIENCLFGVDINPNSVKICRLRLWIELLKNAYYKQTTGYAELETLPNIDINIKQGNSLLSRFALDADLRDVLKKVRYNIEDYQNFVQGYKDTRSREAKRDFEEKIKQIKDDFQVELNHLSPERIKLADLRNQLKANEGKQFLFGEDEDKKQARLKKIESLKKAVIKQERIVKDAEENVIFKNAFEWRFEFPEILDYEGNFLGFDAVIGNPPYGVSIAGELREKIVELQGKVPDFEIYYFFTNFARKILKDKGIKSYIIPNTILFNVFARNYRINLFNNWRIAEIIDCTDFDIFVGSATVRNIITLFVKETGENINDLVGYRPTSSAETFEELIGREISFTDRATLLVNNQNWALVFRLPSEILQITSKIRSRKKLLSDYFPETSQGLIAYDKYQGQDAETIRTRAYHSFEKKVGYKPWLWGEDVTRYSVDWNGEEFIDYCDGIANPREPKYFTKERILVREITNPGIFAGFTKEELYNDPAIINILKPEKEIISIKVLLGILNSKLATFYHFNSSPKATKGAFPKILVDDINNFPIPEIAPAAQEPFIELVDEILVLRRQGKATTAQEQKIDRLVYKLYDLESAEIDIIERKDKKPPRMNTNNTNKN